MANVIRTGNLLLISIRFIFCRNIQDPISINIKSHFNLRNSTRSWSNSGQIKLPKGVVVFCKLPLSLKHLNGHRCLAIRVCGKSI
mmetsp:Transcript_40558/g.56355  ORF Transcript_40558/g.56355 Transcript_40558/m.56355 type:complete len:85 (-) Transcript_40558:278-532(-)